MASEEKLVTAFDEAFNEVEVSRKNSRMINGAYYISNKSCFKMADGSWHRADNGRIGYITGTTSGKWGFINNDFFPVITIDEFDNLVVGWNSEITDKYPLLCFNPLGINPGSSGNPYTYMAAHPTFARDFTPLFKRLLDNHILNNEDFIGNDLTIRVTPKFMAKYGKLLTKVKHDRLGRQVFIFSKKSVEDSLSKMRSIANCRYPKELQYNFANSSYYVNIAKKAFANFKNENANYDKLYKDVFRNKSFGVEIETAQGKIDHNICAQYGMVPLRDGSLDGGIEYTSLPYKSGKGLAAMLDFYNILQASTTTSEKCSLHVHVGGFKRTRLNALVAYKLCYRLQEELFDVMPIYKKELRYWQSKGREAKDHCQSLKSLNINIQDLNGKDDESIEVRREFDKLFAFLTEGVKEGVDYNFKTKNFPKKGQNKWNVNSRYYWVNFLPFIFFDQETVEFRIFNSPLEAEVALYYLLISIAILNFCEDNVETIINGKEKITLEDVITRGLNEAPVVKKILSYIESCRQNNFDDYLKDDLYAEIKRQNSKYGLSSNSMSTIKTRRRRMKDTLFGIYPNYTRTPAGYFSKVEEPHLVNAPGFGGEIRWEEVRPEMDRFVRDVPGNDISRITARLVTPSRHIQLEHFRAPFFYFGNYKVVCSEALRYGTSGVNTCIKAVNACIDEGLTTIAVNRHLGSAIDTRMIVSV